MKFSLFSGSAPQLTPTELVSLLAEQGWDGVEWRVTDQKPADTPGFWAGNRATFPFTGVGSTAQEMRRVAADGGLELSGIAGYVAVGDRAGAEQIIAATAAAGAPVVRLAVPKAAAGTNYRELFEESRVAVREVADIAARHGIKAVIQIHHGNIVSTASAAVRLLEGLDPASIGVIHDLGNLTIEGREGLHSHTPGLQILGDYLAYVHVKNAAWRPAGTRADGTLEWAWDWETLTAGAGDVPSYLASLSEVGYDGWVVVENFTTALPLADRLRADVAYLRGIRARLEGAPTTA